MENKEATKYPETNLIYNRYSVQWIIWLSYDEAMLEINHIKPKNVLNCIQGSVYISYKFAHKSNKKSWKTFSL